MNRDVLWASGAELLSAARLETLCSFADRLAAEGCRLVVVCEDDSVRRLLTVAGFTRRFDLAAISQAA